MPVPPLECVEAVGAGGEHAANAGTATATETAGAVHAAARSTERRLGTGRAGVTGRVVVGMTAQLSRGWFRTRRAASPRGLSRSVEQDATDGFLAPSRFCLAVAVPCVELSPRRDAAGHGSRASPGPPVTLTSDLRPRAFGPSAASPPHLRPEGPCMPTQSRSDLRNVAIVAHVDHGKTTLVDAMLRQAGAFTARAESVADRVMDSATSSARRASRSSRRTPRSTTPVPPVAASRWSSTSSTPRVTPTSVARSSAACRWSTASCSSSTPPRARSPRPASCCARRSTPTCR